MFRIASLTSITLFFLVSIVLAAGNTPKKPAKAPEAVVRTWKGVVAWVIDGDSIRVRPDGKEKTVEIRLVGIDAPEYKQPRGRDALHFVIGTAKGKKVAVEDRGKDRYGRTLARVYLPDGRILNHEILRAGWAWWFRRFKDSQPDAGELKKIEAEAKKKRFGLWADPHPKPPWDWRNGRGKR